jgi:hexosaminidase
MPQESVIPVRAVHLDLKGVPPTPSRLAELPRIVAGLGFNAMVVEWEDTFPWRVNEALRNETAYSLDEVETFHTQAAEHGVQIIPLVQCLGHMEFVLKHDDYAHLRETSGDINVLNPLADGARDLVAELARDVIAATPGLTHFHLGGDEAWSLGTNPDTKEWIAEKGKGDLYLHHVEPILDELNAAGIRPMLWHDMMIDWDSEALTRLAAKADLVLWWYQKDPRTDGGDHISETIIQRFEDHGIRLWGGSAYKGADGPSVDLPDYAEREANALAWVEIARDHQLQGVIATAWSRYSHCGFQCEPIDAALDSLANHGIIFNTCQAPANGREDCLTALDRIGERAVFGKCYSVMEELADYRADAWGAIRGILEIMHCHATDPSRSFGSVTHGEGRAAGFVQMADALTARMHETFDALVPEVWVERYLAERLEPIRDLAGLILKQAERMKDADNR